MPFDDVLEKLTPLTPEEREAAEKYRQKYWQVNAPGVPGRSLDETDVEVVEGDWAACIRQLEEQHLRPLCGFELAQLRIRTGVQSAWSQRGFWVAENANYLPKGDVLFADRRYNPLLKSSEEATRAHREGREFYLEAQVVKELEERAETDVDKAFQSGVLRVPRAKLAFRVLTSAFGEDVCMHFLFREHAQAYGAWRQQQKINAINHYINDTQEKPFGRPFWFNNIDGMSNNARYDYLDYSSGRVGGVRERA